MRKTERERERERERENRLENFKFYIDSFVNLIKDITSCAQMVLERNDTKFKRLTFLRLQI